MYYKGKRSVAKHDRCKICDYSEAAGSSIAVSAPGSQGRVRRYGDDLLCDDCFSEVQENFRDLVKDEDG